MEWDGGSGRGGRGGGGSKDVGCFLFLTAGLQRALKPYTVKAKPTGKELGSGTYGRVIELLSAGEIVAGKVFKISSNVHPQR